MLGYLGQNVIVDIAIPLPRDNLRVLVSNLASNAMNKFERKISAKGAVRAGKGFTLFIPNEDKHDIIKTRKSLEDSNALINGIVSCFTETIKHEIKRQQGEFLPVLLAGIVASLVQPVISSVVNGISSRGVRRAGRGYMDKNF